MQRNLFIGNVAKAPALTGTGDKAVCRFTVISNEYAGKDADGDARERQVAIQFTAFRKKAENIAKHVMKGDQIIIDHRIENNEYEKDGQTVYGFNFVVEDFQFGAPGKAKRETLPEH